MDKDHSRNPRVHLFTHQDRVKKWTSTLAVFASSGALIAVAFGFLSFGLIRNSADPAALLQQKDQARLEGITRTLIEHGKSITDLSSRIASISNLPEDTRVAMNLAAMETRLNQLEEMMTTIEKAVVDNPEKAMSIPLLRSDVTNVKAIAENSVINARNEVERIYDLGKWFLGLMGTMALGILGLAVGNFAKSKGSKTDG